MSFLRNLFSTKKSEPETKPDGSILFQISVDDIQNKLDENKNDDFIKIQAKQWNITDNHLCVLVMFATGLTKANPSADRNYLGQAFNFSCKNYVSGNFSITRFGGKYYLCERPGFVDSLADTPENLEPKEKYKRIYVQDGSAEKELLDAIKNHNLDVAKLAIEKGIPPYLYDTRIEKSALELACWNGATSIVKLLLDKGAMFEPHYIHAIVNSGLGQDDDTELLALWIDKGADVNEKNINNPLHEYGMVSPLQRAAYYDYSEKAGLLIQHGARIDYHNVWGATALHIASERGALKVIRLLLKNGASLSDQRGSYSTPLHHATVTGQIEAMRVLIDNGADVNALIQNKDANFSDKGASSLDIADLLKNSDAIQLLESKGARRFKTLHPRG